eukprot:5634868-Karenia_brevis.AAC.1
MDAELLCKPHESSSAQRTMLHVCKDCGAQYGTNKALLSHMRVRHGLRNPINRFVDSSGICPACGVHFSLRSRVIAHLSEIRQREKVARITCRQRVLAGEFPMIDNVSLQAAAEADRKLAREAYRTGHSHQLATWRASRKRPIADASQDLQPKQRITSKRPRQSITWVSRKRAKLS